MNVVVLSAGAAIYPLLRGVLVAIAWNASYFIYLDAVTTDLVSIQYRAGALSLHNSTSFLGGATGPVLFVGLATIIGYRPLLLVPA